MTITMMFRPIGYGNGDGNGDGNGYGYGYGDGNGYGYGTVESGRKIRALKEAK